MSINWESPLVLKYLISVAVTGLAGALLVGAGVGTLVKVAVETPRLHRRCPDACPWDREDEVAGSVPEPDVIVANSVGAGVAGSVDIAASVVAAA